jgi:hypothetical protein
MQPGFRARLMQEKNQGARDRALQAARLISGAIHALTQEELGFTHDVPTAPAPLTPEQEAYEAAQVAKTGLLETLAAFAMQERSEAETQYLDALPDWHAKTTYRDAIEALRLAMDSVADPEYIKRGVTCPGISEEEDDDE